MATSRGRGIYIYIYTQTRCQKNESSPNFWQNLEKSASSEKYTCFSYLNMHIEI